MSGGHLRRFGVLTVLVAVVAALSGALAVAIPRAADAQPTTALAASALAYPLGLACGSATSCQVVGDTTSLGGVILGTSDAGSTWTKESIPPHVTFPDKLISTYVACPSASECFANAVQGNHPVLLSTTNHGLTWGVANLPSGLRKGFATVACGSATQCVAAGFGLVIGTHNGGKTWSREILPKGTDVGIAGLSCGAPNHCQLVVQEVFGTINGGRAWAREPLPKTLASYQFGAISCHSATTCLAIGGNGPRVVAMSTANGGKTWVLRRLPRSAAEYLGVSCGSTTACFGEFVTPSPAVETLRTSNAGKSWVVARAPSGYGLGDVTCVSATTCQALSGSASGRLFSLRTTNAGRTWAVHPL